MQLALQHLLPIPLRDRLAGRSSGIWQQSLQWDTGGQLFIRAPSGTGKTTLIHSLYGLRTDYDGVIQWDKTTLRNMDAESLSGLRSKSVSIVFQDLRIFPQLTAWENLEIKRQLTNTVPETEVRGWMQRLGIGDKEGALGRTLSYGEQQRLAIIRALLQPFSWLLMDEPFSHLDIANTAKAAALIDEVVRRNGASLLLADLDENRHFSYTQTLLL